MPEHQVTHFTLCRHGKVELGGHRRVYGKLELSLSSEGALQASALVDYVAQQPTYDGIIASDLLRCRQMVAPIADAFLYQSIGFLNFKSKTWGLGKEKLGLNFPFKMKRGACVLV